MSSDSVELPAGGVIRKKTNLQVRVGWGGEAGRESERGGDGGRRRPWAAADVLPARHTRAHTQPRTLAHMHAHTLPPLGAPAPQARQQEMARLQQLGDVLGMGAAEVAAVQQELSEQAFRTQVGV
jgi:hypothetical protein